MGLVVPAGQLEDGALAAARGAHDGDALAPGQAEAHALEDGRALAVGEAHLLEADGFTAPARGTPTRGISPGEIPAARAFGLDVHDLGHPLAGAHGALQAVEHVREEGQGPLDEAEEEVEGHQLARAHLPADDEVASEAYAEHGRHGPEEDVEGRGPAHDLGGLDLVVHVLVHAGAVLGGHGGLHAVGLHGQDAPQGVLDHRSGPAQGVSGLAEVTEHIPGQDIDDDEGHRHGDDADDEELPVEPGHVGRRGQEHGHLHEDVQEGPAHEVLDGREVVAQAREEVTRVAVLHGHVGQALQVLGGAQAEVVEEAGAEGAVKIVDAEGP